MSTPCIQWYMSLSYTLLENWGTGILKRNGLLNGLELTPLFINLLPPFLKILFFCSRKSQNGNTSAPTSLTLAFLVSSPLGASSTYWGIAVSTVRSCGEAWWKKSWSKLSALWIIVMNDKTDVSYAWTFHDLGLLAGGIIKYYYSMEQGVVMGI